MLNIKWQQKTKLGWPSFKVNVNIAILIFYILDWMDLFIFPILLFSNNFFWCRGVSKKFHKTKGNMRCNVYCWNNLHILYYIGLYNISYLILVTDWHWTLNILNITSVNRLYFWTKSSRNRVRKAMAHFSVVFSQYLQSSILNRKSDGGR